MDQHAEKFTLAFADFRAELLYRFRRITDVVTSNYNTDGKACGNCEAVGQLARPSWLHEQCDAFERKARRIFKSNN